MGVCAQVVEEYRATGGALRTAFAGAWLRNLVAHPDVTIEVGAATIPVRARVAAGEERARLFRAQADAIANFDEYQARTSRQIPVVVGVVDPR
jgi:deazaflavin-dependent oxidoreductase (nitroreductase family)